MKITQSTINLVKQFEGFSASAYRGKADKPDVFTIGYGTVTYPDGRKVALTDPDVTKQQAEGFLKAYLERKLPEVARLVTRDLNQPQTDAIMSFVYNLGVGAFKDSTLLKRINLGANGADIRAAFMMWVKSNGATVAGLVKRRTSEADTFLSGS